ncbi:hypothetical protein [Nocardia gipuzkoensis]|uniref:hypothetical protein n=1 Tax=Nocardia gipuzkoensis TaxID=2749991 RepID=UPI003EE0ADC7
MPSHHLGELVAVLWRGAIGHRVWCRNRTRVFEIPVRPAGADPLIVELSAEKVVLYHEVTVLVPYDKPARHSASL